MAFKICTIGCGGISTGCHGPSYVKYRLENPGVELAACCDYDSQRVEEYRKKFGFARSYVDFTEMLTKENPDAVCVTVDEDRSADVGVAVLRLGFPMFIEKPPGKNSGETLRLIDAARQSRVINQVGYNRRYMPVLVKLREMISGAVLRGDVQYVSYDFFRANRFDEDFSDTAVHGIDAVRYIAGSDYKKIRFIYQPLPQFGAGVRNIYMDCEMASGAIARLNFCPVSGAVVERAAVHAKGSIWMANTPVWAESYDRPGEIIHIEGGATRARISGAELCDSDEVYMTNGFYNENKAFFDCLRAGREAACDLNDALHTSLIKDCITDNKESFG